MHPAATLGVFAAALAVVFGAAAGVGSAVGPVGAAPASAPHDAHGSGHAAPAELPGGLAVAQDGYALQLARTTSTAGRPGTLQFAVAGPDGRRLTAYETTHTKELHLVVVRRDGSSFQHLHPTRDDEGRWAVPLTLPAPGPYKVFADFQPVGRDRPLVLAADLTAPGAYVPAPRPADGRRAVVDGYEVALHGDLAAGTTSRLTTTVTRGGRPVTDLDPYLGAYGHLVALRDGDLAYLHVHPQETPGAGPDVVFDAEVPTAAPYRLYLDFSVGGVVRTAAFAVTAAASKDGTHS